MAHLDNDNTSIAPWHEWVRLLTTGGNWLDALSAGQINVLGTDKVIKHTRQLEADSWNSIPS